MSYQAEFFIIDDVGLINLRGTGEVIARFEAVLGLAMPTRPNQVALGKDIAVLSLASDQWWVRTHSCNEQRVFGLLCSAAENLHTAVTIVSDHFTGFSIIGEDTRQILRQGISLNIGRLETGQCTRCGFARCGATVHVIEQYQHYDLFVESSYADYAQLWFQTASGRNRLSD